MRDALKIDADVITVTADEFRKGEIPMCGEECERRSKD